ncbi:MAG: sigma-70 family RNA polymerase sigma factor [Alphaproteobacteria bacterium]|nr:sigma-70 family RNA polymerase sigma factor [Alphaproteobacteria bacterium]
MIEDSPVTETPDADLVRAAVAGDEAALDALAARWWPTMRRWALLETGDLATAEDVAQDAMIKLVHSLSSVDVSRPFEAWVRAIVRNTARDRWRRLRRVLPFLPPPPPPDLDREIDLDRAGRRAREAFASLSPRQREILDLCELQGIAPKDAAEQLGIAPGTARALLHQARAALRAHVADLASLLGDG